MIVCPVCEHPQPHGAECDVCGRSLPAAAAAARASGVPPVEGLEPTLHAPAEAGTDRVADVEPTLHAPAGEVPWEPLELEATRCEAVDVEVLPAPGVERTGVEPPDDVPTAVPAFVACRYCRTTAVPGERICSRCGMRLPVFGPAAAERSHEPRLCSCGLPVPGPGACPGCGARAP